jgi:hypothetical protein
MPKAIMWAGVNAYLGFKELMSGKEK